MIYDEQLSDDVSLSRILDAFIEAEDSPEIVVQFLKQYDSDFKDIAARSLYIDRIYCSDYLRKCSWTEAEYFLSHLEDVDKLSAMYCAWQCLMLAASKPEFAYLKKYAFDFVHNPSNSDVRHPHAGYGYADVKSIDIDFIMNGFCPELAFDAFTHDELEKFINGGAHSLFATRLFQFDCFNACSDLHKFIIIKSLKNLPRFIVCKFTKQLLTSSISPDIKYEIFKQGIISWIGAIDQIDFDSNKELFKMIDKAKNYPSIAIYMTLNGEDAIADCILYMLASGKYKILAEMAEFDEETMEKNFPIKDLIDYIKSNTCLIEAQKHKEK